MTKTNNSAKHEFLKDLLLNEFLPAAYISAIGAGIVTVGMVLCTPVIQNTEDARIKINQVSQKPEAEQNAPAPDCF